jgi:nicotinate dehydrogenase subunit B
MAGAEVLASGVASIAGAVANAVYDATGARLRAVPFTPERVKAALDTPPRT